jgi:hypothetical protein
MEQNYLLTYQKDKKMQYSWFENEDEMQLFVDTTAIDEINEALEIKGTVEVDLLFVKQETNSSAIVLTENERTELLYMKMRGFQFITKNEIGSSTVHKKLPTFYKRGNSYGHWNYELPIKDHRIQHDLSYGHYDFLKFDEEPKRIEDLLNN